MDFLKVNVLEPTDSLTVHIYDIVIEEETVGVSSNTDHPVSSSFQSFNNFLNSMLICIFPEAEFKEFEPWLNYGWFT